MLVPLLRAIIGKHVLEGHTWADCAHGVRPLPQTDSQSALSSRWQRSQNYFHVFNYYL